MTLYESVDKWVASHLIRIVVIALVVGLLGSQATIFIGAWGINNRANRVINSQRCQDAQDRVFAKFQQRQVEFDELTRGFLVSLQTGNPLDTSKALVTLQKFPPLTQILAEVQEEQRVIDKFCPPVPEKVTG